MHYCTEQEFSLIAVIRGYLPSPQDFPHSKRTKLISEDELLTTAASSEMTHSQCPPWDPEVCGPTM